MTNDEAEKLARELLKLHGDISTSASCLVCKLCNHILSGDMKRGIENAAYERAARLHENINPASDAERLHGDPGAGAMGAVIEYRDKIRALMIKP